MGEIIEEEIKIDGINACFKCEENTNRIFNLKLMSNGYIMSHCLKPKWAGSKLETSLVDLMSLMQTTKELINEFNARPPIFNECPVAIDQEWIDYFQDKNGIGTKTELTSFNIRANAKGNLRKKEHVTKNNYR